MSRKREEAWAALVVLGVCLAIAGVGGLWMYMSITATPLHPDVGAVPSVREAEPPAAWAEAAERARQVVRTAVVGQNLPGVSVAVGAGGTMVWAEGFGWARLEDRAPMTPHHRFRIGTASSVLTSAAAGLLIDTAGLDVDADIRLYVPEFPKTTWPITARQLMAHVAGLRSDGGDEGPLFGRHCERPVDAFPAFADRPLLFEPGTQFRFSNFGWIVVSAAVEAVSGTPFLRFMRDAVFEPMGMHDTEADPDLETNPLPNRVTPYFPRFAADPRYGPEPMRPLQFSCYAGASVFLSTPADLVRFGIAMLEGRLLRPSTVDLLQASQRLRTGEETGYGLGWAAETVSLAGRPTRMVGHDGRVLGGTAASFRIVPAQGLVVAVVSNTSYADTPGIAETIVDVFAAVNR